MGRYLHLPNLSKFTARTGTPAKRLSHSKAISTMLASCSASCRNLLCSFFIVQRDRKGKDREYGIYNNNTNNNNYIYIHTYNINLSQLTSKSKMVTCILWETKASSTCLPKSKPSDGRGPRSRWVSEFSRRWSRYFF